MFSTKDLPKSHPLLSSRNKIMKCLPSAVRKTESLVFILTPFLGSPDSVVSVCSFHRATERAEFPQPMEGRIRTAGD